jgi:hypothetical protein
MIIYQLINVKLLLQTIIYGYRKKLGSVLQLLGVGGIGKNQWGSRQRMVAHIGDVEESLRE